MRWRNIEISQKTTKIYEIHFTKDEVAQDITGWTIYFIVKEKMGDPDTSAVITKEVTTHSNPTIGETEIELLTSDTNITPGNYYYSIDYLDDSGNEGVLFQGRLKIARRVRD